MGTASIATHQHLDCLSYVDHIRTLSGLEVLEQALFEQDTQMEFGGKPNSNLVEKRVVGSILNICNSVEHPQQTLANSFLGYVGSTNLPIRNTQITSASNQGAGTDFAQYMEFVDSPPDSKEAWPAEYLKSAMQGPNKMVGIDAESRSTPGPNSPANDTSLSKKRRMNWDEVPGQNTNDGNAPGKDHLQMERRKLARFSGNTGVADNTQQGEGNQSNGAGNASSGNANHQGNLPGTTNNGSGAWGDDIDFDLNNELYSNSNMNDALFYHSLGGFKQEVPSPSQDKTMILKLGNANNNGTGTAVNAGGELLGKRVHGLISGNDVSGLASADMQPHQNMNGGSPNPTGNNANAGATDIINSLQNHQQQLCLIQQGNQNAAQNGNISGATTNGHGSASGNATGNPLNDFQQLLQDTTNFHEKINGNSGGTVGTGGGLNGRVMTPPQIDKPLMSTACSNDDARFQYVLAAATSIATKSNEDTLTYLNQGQSYEIKLKKLGDLTSYRNKVLTSVIKICFYERRLQYMEREQMQQWQLTRPGERILEIDVPLSFGCHPSQSANPNEINRVEVMWDPMKEVGVYIKVNCISTEFTPKKHGGEKGVPFRIQVETFLDGKPVHGAMCQIKVFKLKGADRKHKQDREKIQKRPMSEQEKFQPSYECTILNDIPRDLLQQSASVPVMAMSPSDHIPAVMHSPPTATGNKFEPTGLQFAYTSNSNSSSNSVGFLNRQASTSNPNLCKTLEFIPSPPATLPAKDIYEMQNIQITKDTSPQHLTQWINFHRLSSHMSTFAHFSGSDLLRLTKDDLIQICGLADGIRMYNILHKKAITPRLTIFVSFDGAYFHAVYLDTNKLKELVDKTQNLPGFRQFYAKKQTKSEGQTNGNGGFMWDMQQGGKGLSDDENDFDLLLHLPSGILVMMTEDVISHLKDESSYMIVVENHRVILRPIAKE